MRVVATAGHVDHGKSTLVKALTGEDPDRWAEEKARGLTIDLGFAATTLPSGREIAFVDVPGHGRLVKNMLAGVGSVDACLFVVAATEGWKEQTEEHLRILELVGVRHGVVALTKVGLVDDDWSQLVALEVQDRLAGTFLADAEVVAVDVPAMIGLEGLRLSLDRLAGRVPASPDRGRPRLWVDRSFSVQGFGTVVTGTLTGGSMALGQEVVIDPGGHHGRVRSLQSHRSRLEEASPGRRLAVNVSGLSRTDARRGQVLVRPDQWHLTTTFDATLDVLGGVDHPVGHRGAYVVYVGSGEFPARLRLIGSRDVGPGEAGTARFLLQTTAGIPLVPGDRYVLREAGRFETVGGGEILDVEPVVPTGRAQPSRSLSRVVGERGWVEADHLFRITGERAAPTVGRWVVDPSALTVAGADLVERCRAAGVDGVDLAVLDERARAIVDDGLSGVEVRGDRLVDSSVAPPEGMSESARRVLETLDDGGWSPELPPMADRAALRELERLGLAVEAGEVWFSASSVHSAVGVLGRLLEAKPDGLTVSEARDALGSSRKYVVSLLTYLDSTGMTRRRGDCRVAGPRLGVGT
ncbi:MAG TPA: selenocysteine-specific translation elongation factor [Acidimicrobiales bacterium]|nr:selenocysteine-specific translation elongation factor [Acidimicrobiales bacterium]